MRVYCIHRPLYGNYMYLISLYLCCDLLPITNSSVRLNARLAIWHGTRLKLDDRDESMQKPVLLSTMKVYNRSAYK